MNLTEAQAEKVLSTWRISRLEDILGPELSPRSWSNNLRKHLCMLCRLVNLEQARILLSNEVTARLANRTRNRGIRRDHLSDVDVMRVLDRQEAQIRGHSDVYSQYSPSPAANQPMRRLDRVSETPDYTRPYPPGPSPDLSADASSYHPSTASSPASTSASTSITTAPSSNPRTGPSLQWSSTALQLLARNAAAGSRSDYYDAGPSTFDDGDRRMSLGGRRWYSRPLIANTRPAITDAGLGLAPTLPSITKFTSTATFTSPASEIVVQIPETKTGTLARATNYRETNRRETNVMAAPPPRARSPTTARTSSNSVAHTRAEELPRSRPTRTTDDPEPNTTGVASPRQRPPPITSLKTDTSAIRAMTEPPQRTQTTAPTTTTTTTSSSSSWNSFRPESHIPASTPQGPWPGTTSRTNNPPEHRPRPPDPPRRSESSTTPMTDDTEGITVVERHKRKRESMMADLEGDIEKLGYRVDIQRTTVKLRQHEYAQEQRHLEAARAKLESLSSGDAVAAQMDQFQGFLAGLDDLVARYPAVLHAHDDHSANDMGRALASPSQPPEETDMGLQPGMLFDALKRAVRVKMDSAAHQTERLQDTRRVGERELRVAQAAVDETLATLERAREDLSKLEDDLHFLSIEKERLSDRFGS
ncbi:hypothetical protein CGCS363_v011593 [Colletotrichum siamense]|uniref:uncharacterized protein n=1 Tax=Colletotrichum siamense TaxID=690259 RepID=UPI001872EE33|nr:uncharacterized protein CGCS363_v011593 [Colletotrichum siamense]KAF5492619.1 hypothetical protein CGCS363_v011593 [Colletotrichum siamense]